MTATDLLLELVRISSPSGQEERAARQLGQWARGCNLSVVQDETSVRVELPGRESGPLLLLVSHLDTVPPGEGWTVDPFAGTVKDGWLWGRGAVDAKASVAAMAAATATLASQGGLPRGRLVFLATFSEETANTTLPLALKRLTAKPDAAVVGEPTGLEPCVAQRGLLILRVAWRGEQRHAGWAAAAGERLPNAIEDAARDLLVLRDIDWGPPHPVLGPIALIPTMAEAGVARNVTPPRCTITFDVRTTPSRANDAVVQAVRDAVSGEVEVVSSRFLPAETPADSALLAAHRRVRPDAVPFGSPTASDWVFLRDIDTVKLGPGDSRRSHTPDERVLLSEVEAAAERYAALVRAYLG